VFGHSSGALVALRAALTLPRLDKIAVYEPPLSEHGSIPTSWIPRFDREVALGKPAAALVTFVKADNLVPAYLPRWLLVPLIALYFGWEKRTVRPRMSPCRISSRCSASTGCWSRSWTPPSKPSRG